MANNESGQTNPQQEDKEAPKIAHDAATSSVPMEIGPLTHSGADQDGGKENTNNTQCKNERADESGSDKTGGAENTKMKKTEKKEEKMGKSKEKTEEKPLNQEMERNKQLWEQDEGLFVPPKFKMISREEFESLRHDRDMYQKMADDYANRLSAIASENLKDGQTDINDLADQNRPSKLCEMFSELYNEQWATAFDGFQDEGSEEEIVNQLLQVVKDTFEFCQQEAVNDLESLTKELYIAMEGDEKIFSDPKQRQEDPNLQHAIKHAKQIRKELVHLKIANIQNAYIKSQTVLGKKHLEQKDINEYVKLCVKLCWLMAIQSPPMYLLFTNPGEKLNPSLFGYHQEKGKYVKSCVWPALLREKGGALFSKGMANGTKQRS